MIRKDTLLPRRLLWLLLPACALFLDWISKLWILHRLQPEECLPVIPGFFNLTLGFNRGAIFGSFQGAPDWVRIPLFTLAGLAALGYFGYEFLRADATKLQRTALGLILGGAVGNGLDRLTHGAVVDFLDFYVHDLNLGFTYIRVWHYWAFNIADSCILVGAILYAIVMILQARHGKSSS